MLDPEKRAAFITQQGWGDARYISVGEDWSQRQFARLIKPTHQSSILMHSYPDDDARATPGHKLGDYVRIAKYLRGIDIYVPDIYASDVSNGLLLVEDFGDVSLHDAFLSNDARLEKLYTTCADVLTKIYRHTHGRNDVSVPEYFEHHVYKGHRRIVEWYMPAKLNKPVSDEILQEYLAIWAEIEANLPAPQKSFQHGDFHPHNIMVLNEAGELGFIDFQGGLFGPAPYDLVNLLEDIRRDVPAPIKQACIARYRDILSPKEFEEFMVWYDVLSCQFHCRIAGQAIKLAVMADKDRLLEYLPFVEQGLRNDLKKPVFAKLSAFFAKYNIGFDGGTVHRIPSLFASDAF